MANDDGDAYREHCSPRTGNVAVVRNLALVGTVGVTWNVVGGLIVWIRYVATDSDTTGWIAFALLAVVALIGFTMLARWILTYRA